MSAHQSFTPDGIEELLTSEFNDWMNATHASPPPPDIGTMLLYPSMPVQVKHEPKEEEEGHPVCPTTGTTIKEEEDNDEGALMQFLVQSSMAAAAQEPGPFGSPTDSDLLPFDLDLEGLGPSCVDFLAPINETEAAAIEAVPEIIAMCQEPDVFDNLDLALVVEVTTSESKRKHSATFLDEESERRVSKRARRDWPGPSLGDGAILHDHHLEPDYTDPFAKTDIMPFDYPTQATSHREAKAMPPKHSRQFKQAKRSLTDTIEPKSIPPSSAAPNGPRPQATDKKPRNAKKEDDGANAENKPKRGYRTRKEGEYMVPTKTGTGKKRGGEAKAAKVEKTIQAEKVNKPYGGWGKYWQSDIGHHNELAMSINHGARKHGATLQIPQITPKPWGKRKCELKIRDHIADMIRGTGRKATEWTACKQKAEKQHGQKEDELVDTTARMWLGLDEVGRKRQTADESVNLRTWEQNAKHLQLLMDNIKALMDASDEDQKIMYDQLSEEVKLSWAAVTRRKGGKGAVKKAPEGEAGRVAKKPRTAN